MRLPRWTRQVATYLLVGGMDVAFAVLFSLALYHVFSAASRKVVTESDAVTYLTTALAATAGGYLTFAFANPAGGSNIKSASNLGVAGGGVTPLLGALLVIAYVLGGIAAGVAWIVHPHETSVLVKNLAITFLGLALPLVLAAGSE